MVNELVKKSNIVLLFLLPIVFVFLFGVWGYDLTDNPYMRGYAYSMMHGKRMYLDLFSRLPPGGYLLQKWFYTIVGDFYPVFLNRFFFYFNNSLIAFLLTIVVTKHKFININFNNLILQFFFFLLMINNFPASMGYAHVSMFLGALAILLVYLDLFFIAGVVLSFSMLTKQTFAAFIFLIPIIMYFKKVAKGRYLSFFVGLLITSIYIFFYFRHDLPFLHKMTLRHTLGAVYRSGFRTYFRFSDLYQVVGLIGFLFSLNLMKTKKIFFRTILFVFMIGLLALKKLEIQAETLLSLHQTHKVLFLFSFYFVAKEIHRHYKKRLSFNSELIFFIIIFLLAWVSGLNDSATGPVFIVSLFLIPLKYILKNKDESKRFIDFTIFYFALTLVMNVNAYRDGSRLNMNKHLGEIDKRYSMIYTNENKFEKIKELVKLKKEKIKIIALPTFSDANFLLRQLNCLPTVWDVATGLSNPSDELLSKVKNSILKCSDHTFLLEKGITRRYTLYTPMIPKMFRKVGESKYFEIYKGLK